MKDYVETAKIFKAIGDEKRLYILDLLLDGEKCACDILANMKISQPTLSHHMKLLREAGFVKAREDGKWTHYSISEAGLRKAQNLLQTFLI